MILLRLQASIALLHCLSAFTSQANDFSSGYIGKIESDTSSYISPFRGKNEKCLICHGQVNYEYASINPGNQVKALMLQEMIIDRDMFYRSNHKSFSCTDCHSDEYTKFPHPAELQKEMSYNCLDCHGSDVKFAKFKFEEIDSDYQKSVHFRFEDKGFTCWSCHNPHEDKVNIRDNKNLKEAILYDNNICLGCHSNHDHFHLFSDKEELNIMKQHDWLPDESAHFKSLRCIDCHSAVNDSILVSHKIITGEKAVRKCNECHSTNSFLLSSLYKFKSHGKRNAGFTNGIMLNQSYVVGANRNKYLEWISYVIFCVVLIAIGIHLFLRIHK